MPDYDALRGDTGGLPPDGVHDAHLDRASLIDTRKGEMLVTEWRTQGDPLYWWTTWFRFDGQGLAFTLAFLDAIGVDRTSLADTDGNRLEDALDARLGLVYAVRTKRWGSDGGGGVNVTVEGEQLQTSLDASVDTSDLLEPTAAAVTDDEDIPF